MSVATLDDGYLQMEQRCIALERKIAMLEEVLNYVDTVVTNTDMSYPDRIMSVHLVATHRDEVLDGKPFVVNVINERKSVGLSKDSAARYFSGMKEAGGINYEVKTTSDGRDKINSTSTVSFLPGSQLVNTRMAASREEERAKDSMRYARRMRAIAVSACPHCGCDDPIKLVTGLVQMCIQCGKTISDPGEVEIVKTKDVRVEEDVIDRDRSEAEGDVVVEVEERRVDTKMSQNGHVKEVSLHERYERGTPEWHAQKALSDKLLEGR